MSSSITIQKCLTLGKGINEEIVML